ncbi:unnamed protein product [Lampetra planeri]
MVEKAAARFCFSARRTRPRRLGRGRAVGRCERPGHCASPPLSLPPEPGGGSAETTTTMKKKKTKKRVPPPRPPRFTRPRPSQPTYTLPPSPMMPPPRESLGAELTEDLKEEHVGLQESVAMTGERNGKGLLQPPPLAATNGREEKEEEEQRERQFTFSTRKPRSPVSLIAATGRYRDRRHHSQAHPLSRRMEFIFDSENWKKKYLPTGTPLGGCAGWVCGGTERGGGLREGGVLREERSELCRYEPRVVASIRSVPRNRRAAAPPPDVDDCASHLHPAAARWGPVVAAGARRTISPAQSALNDSSTRWFAVSLGVAAITSPQRVPGQCLEMLSPVGSWENTNVAPAALLTILTSVASHYQF